MNRHWVLLHGFSGHPQSWDDVATELAAHGEVLRPALTGHAPEAGPAVDFPTEVDRLGRAIAGALPAPRHLCGYSLGGRVALGLLVRHPALFCSATLIGAHPGLPSHGAERQERAAADERWAQLAATAPAEFHARWGSQPLFATQQQVDPPRRTAQQRLRALHDGRALGEAMRALSLARMPDWRPCLPHVTLPVHLVVGELDAKFIGLAREMLGLLPRATLTVVPGTGHNVVLERPQAIVDALLRAPFDDADTAAPRDVRRPGS